MKRADRHKQVKALKEQGLTFNQIAARLGLAKSTVTNAYYDATGEKDRARRERYKGVCVDCGATTNNGGSANGPPDRCLACATKMTKTLDYMRVKSAEVRGATPRWSEAQMLDAIREVAHDGFITRKDYSARRTEAMPDYQTIHKRIGWGEACDMAGVATVANYRKRSDHVPREGVICAVQDCAAELGKMPTYREYEQWAKRTGAPGGQTVRNRFDGLWMDAIEAALADMAVAA